MAETHVPQEFRNIGIFAIDAGKRRQLRVFLYRTGLTHKIGGP